MRRVTILAVTLLLVLPPMGDGPASAVIERRTVVPCRSGNSTCWPTAFTFTPTGNRIWYVERFTGQIRIHNPSTGGDSMWKRIGNLSTSGEQGVLGIALDPRWPDPKWVYVYYTRTGPRNVIERFRQRNDGSFQTERLLSIPAANIHNGGVIHFGPDRKLYAETGDASNPANAQNTSSRAGKLLRMNADGDPPASNPFGNLVYSYGHRNSFGFTFDPETDDPWEPENGPECNDEINHIPVKGMNYGWGPSSMCPATNTSGPNPQAPEITFTPTIAPTGAAFCDGCGLGAAREGNLLFGAFNDGLIRMAEINANRNGILAVTTLFSNGDGILAVEAAPNGRIHFSDDQGIYRLVNV